MPQNAHAVLPLRHSRCVREPKGSNLWAFSTSVWLDDDLLTFQFSFGEAYSGPYATENPLSINRPRVNQNVVPTPVTQQMSRVQFIQYAQILLDCVARRIDAIRK